MNAHSWSTGLHKDFLHLKIYLKELTKKPLGWILVTLAALLKPEPSIKVASHLRLAANPATWDKGDVCSPCAAHFRDDPFSMQGSDGGPTRVPIATTGVCW